MMRPVAALLTVVSLSACGVASVSPIVTDATAIQEAGLIGKWGGGSESVEITASHPLYYSVVHTDGAKVGRFIGRFGNLGRHRVLDLQPEQPTSTDTDTYKSLVLRAHGIAVIDSIGSSIVFRILDADSVKAYLRRNPRIVAHTFVDESALLTGSSADSRKFLESLLDQPGILGERNVWQRAR